jgi:predicted membrane channel-forming protein YqfA (hemolysin III family)
MEYMEKYFFTALYDCTESTSTHLESLLTLLEHISTILLIVGNF